MTEEITKAPDRDRSIKETSTNDLLGSQRVYKKSSPNSMLTIYLPTRELVSRNGVVAPLKGVLYADPKFVQGHRIFGQLTLTFRYGREDEEVMGLRFCNEAVMCLAQIWPPSEDKDKDQTLTLLQDALVKRLGEGSHPFTMEVTPQAPPSVQLVPAKRYYGAPIGTSYDIRCYVADRSDEKLHRRSTVRMGIRLIHKTHENDNQHQTSPPENFTTIVNSQQQNGSTSSSSGGGSSVGGSQQHSTPTCSSSTSSTTTTPPSSSRSCKNERIDSFTKIKLSPKTFRFTGKLCRSKSEIEKGSTHDIYEHELISSHGGPQGSIDKPFLLQEGKVGLRASLDKSMYGHGENVLVTVNIKNDSRKTVRRIRVSAVQHVDVCMFSNGKFKNIVAETDQNSTDFCVKPNATLHTTYTLHPQRGPTKNWIALEDSLQRCNEPNAINALIASSALRHPPTNIEDRNVFAIYVSYYVKIKLTLSGMGGELSLKLPFQLAHIDKATVTSTITTTATTTIIGDNIIEIDQQQQQQKICDNGKSIEINNKLIKEKQQQQQTIETIDKIEKLTDNLELVDKANKLLILKHSRQDTLTISSADEERDDDIIDVDIVTDELLNSPETDRNYNTETTCCVEIHNTQSSML